MRLGNPRKHHGPISVLIFSSPLRTSNLPWRMRVKECVGCDRVYKLISFPSGFSAISEDSKRVSGDEERGGVPGYFCASTFGN